MVSIEDVAQRAGVWGAEHSRVLDLRAVTTERIVADAATAMGQVLDVSETPPTGGVGFDAHELAVPGGPDRHRPNHRPGHPAPSS